MKSVEELKMHVLVHPVDRQRLTVKLPKTGYTDIEISHAPSCCILGNVKTSAVKEKSGFR
ncbi:MAG TPA: hypothetical protein VIP56_12010 [Nitrososphaeraceae archaeon]